MNIKRSYIIVTAIVVLTLIIVSLLLNRAGTGTLEITTPDKTPGDAAISIEIHRDGVEEEAFTLQPGETRKLRLKTGTVRVDGWADTLRAVDIVEIKGFGATTLKTPTAEQRAAEQLASDIKYCPVVVADVTYSYGCEGEGVITHHKSNNLGSSLNTTLFSGTSFSGMKPLKNGLIGFYATAGLAADMQYVDLASRTVTQVSLPEDVKALLADDQPQIATTTDPTASQFALLFSSKNKIYVFDDTDDTSPMELKPGKDVRLNQQGRIVRLSFHDDKPILFAGTSTDLHEGEVPGETNQGPSTTELPRYLFEYDSAGKITKTYTIPDELDAQGVYKLEGGFYAADQPQGFGFYRADGDELVHVYTITDMSSWTISDGRAYVVAGGTLYEFSPSNNGLFRFHGLFSSSNITVSSLFNGPDGIIFTGLTSTAADAPINAYRLLAKGEKPAGGNQNGDGDEQVRGAPIVTSIDDLVYLGISSFQADNLRYALGVYASQAPAAMKTIDITDAEAAPHNPDSIIQSVSFGLSVDSEPALKAKMEYFDLSAVHLYIYDAQTNKLVYDSGVINHKEPPAYNPEPQH
jgi:hypothetical protein